MSPLKLIDLLVVQPLVSIYEQIFGAIETALQTFFFEANLGWTLVLFSLVVNLMLLPLYYQMERSSRSAHAQQAPLQDEVRRIKAHFTGRERFFYLRTIYRHYGSSPLSVMTSSPDLYVQVLIFATVYRFIDSLPNLAGSSFYSIDDLGRPDGLLFGFNLLPILMLTANISAALVHRNHRTRVLQTLFLALVFVVLLYDKPAGLVLYWTCNNLFGLARSLLERQLAYVLPASLRRNFNSLARQQ